MGMEGGERVRCFLGRCAVIVSGVGGEDVVVHVGNKDCVTFHELLLGLLQLL